MNLLATLSRLNGRAILTWTLFILTPFFSFSQTTYTWNNPSGGDWGQASNWSPARTLAQASDILQFSDGNAYVVTGVPTQTVRRLIVSGNTSVHLQSAAAATLSINGPSAQTNLQVQTGSTLRLAGGGNNLALAFSTTSNQQANISGELILDSGGTVSSSVATQVCAISGTLRMLAGGTYVATSMLTTISGNIIQEGGSFTSTAANFSVTGTAVYLHLANGGQVPTASWDPASSISITGITTTAPTGISGQTLGNVTYNCAGQSVSNLLLGLSGTTTVSGNFIIQNSNGNDVELFSTTGTLVVLGNLIVQAGTLNVNTAASANTLNLHGDLIVNSGATLTRTGATGTATIEFFGDGKVFNTSAGTFNTATFAFTINAAASITQMQNVEVTSTRTYTVNGKLDLGTHEITGAGTFTLAGTLASRFTTAHTGGIALAPAASGAIQTTTRTFGNSNYVYKGTSAQVTGTGLPATIRSLTVDNSHAGGLTLTNALTITDTNEGLKLLNGRLLIGENNLNIGSTIPITGSFSANAMIVTNGGGQLIRAIGTGASVVVYPIGDVAGTPDYSPVTLDFANLGTARTIGFRVVNSLYPQFVPAGSYATRYWIATSNGTSPTHTLDATFGYNPLDVVGSDGGFSVIHYNTATNVWQSLPGSNPANAVVANVTNAFGTLPLEFVVVAADPSPVYYRSVNDGNWNNPAIWEVAAEPTFSNPQPAVASPNNLNSDAIIISSGTTVTVSAAQSADDLVVNGNLVIAAGVTLTVANGPADWDMIVHGTVTNGNGAAIGTITSTGAVYFDNGSVYEHARTGGAIAAATWHANSTCLLSGYTTGLPTGLNQNFGHLTWNNTGQSQSTLVAAINTQGNFNLMSTSTFVLGAVGSTSSSTWNIGGNFNLTGGEVMLKQGTTGTSTINVGGNFNLSGGILNLSISTSSGNGVLNINGNYNQTGGTITSTASSGISVISLNGPSSQYIQSAGTVTNTTINYQVNGADANVTLTSPISPAANRQFNVVLGTLNVPSSGIQFANGGSMTVSNGGILNLGPNLITNAAGTTTFTVANGGTLIIGHAEGISSSGATGNIRVTGTRTYNAAVRYIYNGGVPQVTGAGLPATLSSSGALHGYLEINNASGVTLSGSVSITSTGAAGGLMLSNGHLLLGNNNLTIAAVTPLNGTFSNTSMVVTNGTGQLLKTFAAGIGPFTFPIGDNAGTAEYSPVTIEFTQNGAGNVGLRVVDDVHPNNGAAADYLSRYFVTTSTIATPYSYNLSLSYDAGDVTGSEGAMLLSRWNGSVWTALGSAVGSGTAVTSVPLTSTTAPLAATSNFSARTGSVNYYRTASSGQWTDAANWEVDTDPEFGNPSVASQAPSSANSAFILIRPAHTITYSFSSTHTVNVLRVEGTLVNQTTGATNLLANGNIYFESGSEYRHERDGGFVPTAIWNAASTFRVLGIVGTAATGFANQSFGNLVWNCTGQTAAVNIAEAGSALTVAGNLSILSTGSGSVAPRGGATFTLTVGGDFVLNGGTFNMNGSGTSATTFNLAGSYLQGGGLFQRGNTGTGHIFNFTNTGDLKYLSRTAGTLTLTGITINVNALAVVELQTALEVNIFNVVAGGTFFMNDHIITGTTFSLASSATSTLGIGHAEGIVTAAGGAFGNVRTTSRTYGAACNYVYTGTVAQVTGNGLPATIGGSSTLTIKNTSSTGVTLSAAAIIAGTLNLEQGQLILGNVNLTLSNANSALQLIGGPFASNRMIVTNGTGELIRTIPLTASLTNPYIYPVGTGANYTPAEFNFATNAARNIGVRVVASAHPNVGAVSDYINRHWLFSNSVATGVCTYSVTLSYADGDVVGNESNLRVNVFQSATWYGHQTILDTDLNTLTIPTSGALNHLSIGNSLTGTAITARGDESNAGLHFRTVASGNWSNPSVWEVSMDPTFINPAPVTATYAPSFNTAATISIVNDHLVTLDANVVVDDLLINDGSASQLVIPSGRILTVNNLNGTTDLTLAGSTPRMLVHGSVICEGGISGGSANNLVFQSGSLYRHARNGGTVPSATWDPTSTMEVTGITTTAVTGLNQNFGNFTWNCTGQTLSVQNMAKTTTGFTGTVRVISTGSGQLTFQTTTTGYTYPIGGDLRIDGGILSIRSGATGVLNVDGSVLISGGTLQSVFASTINFAGTASTFSQTSGTLDNTNINYGVLAGASATLNSGLTIEATREMLVSPGGVLNLAANITAAGFVRNNGRINTGSFVISGTGSYIQGTSVANALNNSILSVGHAEGFNSSGATGAIQTTTRTLNNPSNYIYESTVTNAGNGFAVAATQGTMTFNGCTLTLGAGFTTTTLSFINADVTLGGAITVTGTGHALQLTASLVRLENHDLITTGVITLPDSYGDSNMIVTDGSGFFYRQIPATASLVNPYVYPVGDGGSYSPAVLNFTAAAAGRLGARAVADVHPDMGASSDYLERFWRFSVTTGLATYTYGAELHYSSDDIVGDEADLLVSSWDGSDWSSVPSTVIPSDNILSFPSIGTLTQISGPLNNRDFTGRNTDVVFAYRTAATGNWSNPATWEVSTDPTFVNPAPVPATQYPTADNSSLIRFLGGYEVTLDVDLEADQMDFVNTVDTKLIIATNKTLTLKDGPGVDLVMTANARLDVHGALIGEGLSSGNSATTTNFFSGSSYEHRNNGAGNLIPVATWDANSTLLITGLVATNPTALGAATGGFGHIIYNCPNQTAALTLGMSTGQVKGNFTLVSTGTGSLTFGNSTQTITILGDFVQQGGSFGMTGYTSSTSASAMTLTGHFNQTGGSFAGVLGTGTGAQTINFAAGPNRNYICEGTIYTERINFAVAIGATLTLQDSISLDLTGRTFTNNGTLWMRDKLITGVAGTSFTNTSATTTTLGTWHADGLAAAADGNIGAIRTATRTYGIAANYAYNGSSVQRTGSGLTTCNSLTVDNAAGVVQRNDANTTQNVVITATLTLTSGTYDIGGVAGNLNTLTLNGPAISPPNSSSLLSNSFSNLAFGPGAGNTNAGLYIPSSISSLNALSINVQGVNTVTLNSSIGLHQTTGGVLTLTSGRLVLGNHDLTILSPAYTATVTGGSLTAMVVADGDGHLRKNFGTSGFAAFTFPIGDVSGPSDVADYSPFAITFTSNSDERIIGVRVKDEEHPNNGTPAHYITRHWFVKDFQPGGDYTFTNLALTHSTNPPTDVVGTPANFRVNRWTGSGWSQLTSTGGATTSTGANVNSRVTCPLDNTSFTSRVNDTETYVWQATSGSASWTNPSSWSPARFSPQPTDVLQFSLGGTSTATDIPSETVAKIIVTNSTNVSFSSASAQTISVNGPTLENNILVTGLSSLTLLNGVGLTYLTTASQRGSIAGTLNVESGSSFITSALSTTIVNVESGGVINQNGGTITGSAATFKFLAGSEYRHHIVAGAIPTAEWNAASTASVFSNASGTLGGTGQSFGNFILNTPSAVVTTLGASVTGVQGNFNIISGTLNAAGLTITGNASGTFFIGAGGSFVTTRTSAPWLPTLFTLANTTLDPLSSVSYLGLGNHIIPVDQVTAYGRLVVGGSGSKTMAGAISVRDLDIQAGGFFDGGFQITGHAAGTLNAAAGTTFQLGAATAAITLFPTNFVSSNVTLSPTSTVNYSTITNPQTISAVPVYGNLTITGANVKQLAGNTTVAGNLTIATAGATLDDSGFIITVNGNISNVSSTPGHIGAGKILLTGGAAAHALSGAGSYTNIELNDSNGATIANNCTINGVLTLTEGSFGMTNQILFLHGGPIATGTGSLVTTTASNITFGPNTNTAVGLHLPASVTDLNNLSINVATGTVVALGGPLSVHSASSAITLTQGILETSEANLLTVVNTAVAAINTGSTTAFVRGPLRRNLPLIASGTNTYRFPIGATVYAQAELLNPITSSALHITARVFDGTPGGTAGSGVIELNNNRYWHLEPGAAVINTVNVRFTEPAMGPANRVTQSATSNGIYNSVGGSISAPTITATAGQVDAALGFFRLGNTGMTYTSSTVIHPTLTAAIAGGNDQQILRVQIVTAAGSPVLNVQSFSFNTNGTTVAADISSARVYYTGSSTAFSTVNPYGSIFPNPNGTFVITGSQDLSAGNNYFFLVYNIASAPSLCNAVDAECTAITLNTGSVTPSVTAPAGSRPISQSYCIPGNNASLSCELGVTCFWTAAVNITGGGGNYFSYSNSSLASMTYTNLSGNNYDGPAAPLIPGQSCTFSVTRGGSGSGQAVRLFVDWNNDGDFTDSGELVISTTGTATATTTVPIFAQPGCHRMRVAMGSVSTDPCDPGLFNLNGAEWRDFSFTVGEACIEPTVQASSFSFSNVTTTSSTVTFDRGNGDGGVIVVARAGSAVNQNPVSGITYSGNSSFGSGSQIGSGNYVVFAATGAGSGTVNVPVSNLTPGVTYHFAVYEYNALNTCYNLTALTGNIPIPVCLPPSVQASGSDVTAITQTTASVNWSSSGNGDAGVLVVMRQGSPVSANPTQLSSYISNAQFGLGSQIGTGNFVVFAGAGSTVGVTGLMLNSTYYYAIYTYNSSGPCYMIPAHTGSFNTANGPMTYVSSTSVQITGGVPISSVNQPIVRLDVVAGLGTNPPLTVSNIQFSIDGSTTASDIAAARIYFTGSSNVFDTAQPFGTAVSNPTGTHTVSGSAVLQSGTNYFWVAYDVPVTATVGNVLDAEVISLNAGGTQTPAISAPAGNRPITSLLELNCAYNYSFHTGFVWPMSGGVLAQSSFTPFTTTLASGTGIDDQVYTNIPLGPGFQFEYMGQMFTTVNVSANGFIYFGTPTATGIGGIYQPLSSNFDALGVISALGADIQAHNNASTTPAIRVATTGTAPNRVFWVEWTAFRPYNNSSVLCSLGGYPDANRLDFLIRLYENGGPTENRIDISVRDMSDYCVSGNSLSAQTGLRGVNNTQFLNRFQNSGNWTVSSAVAAGVSGASNSALSANWGGSNYANGNYVSDFTFRYTPTIQKPITNVTGPVTNACPDLNVPLSTTSTAPSLQWFSNGLAVDGATSSSFNAAQSGQYVVVAYNGACGRVSDPIDVTIVPCGNCTGFPAPGSTTTSANLVCPGVPFTLGVSNTILPGGNLSYVFQRANSGVGPWTTISSNQLGSLTIPSIDATTWYRVRVNCLSSGQTGIASAIQVAVAPNCGPIPELPASGNTDILGVTINGNFRNTDCSAVAPGPGSIPGVYGNYITLPSLANVVRGANSGFDVSVGSCGPNFNPSRLAIFVDFNHNGLFELSEKVFEEMAPSTGPNVRSGTFEVPLSATNGATLMRLILAEGVVGEITPTTVFSQGEVEDHVVTIVNPPIPNDYQATATLITPAQYPACSSSLSVNLALATPSPETGLPGNAAWYRFTPTTNGAVITVTGANDLVVQLHDDSGVLVSENAVVVNGNETLVYGNYVAGQQYWVAVVAAGTPSVATICISQLRRSGCDNPTTFNSPCLQFKNTFTSANTYSVFFDDDGMAPFIATSSTTGGQNLHPLFNFVGLPPMISAVNYLVRVDATYNLQNAAGTPVSVTIPGTFNCTRSVTPHPNVFLRNEDAAPNVKPANALLFANTWVCADYYEWSIQQYSAINGTPTAPIATLVNGPVNNRILNIQPLGLAPGGIYRVLIRPIFNSGPGNFGPERWLIIAGSAGMIVEESSETGDETTFQADPVLYPNPIRGDRIWLNWNRSETAQVTWTVTEASGRMVARHAEVMSAGQTELIFSSDLAPGIYFLELLEGDRRITLRFVAH